MSTRKLRRASLEALVASGRLTPEGADWLTLSLDPFHDYQKQVAGYPDADCSNTVVECFQYATDISKPAGVAGNWDLHVFSQPSIANATVGEILGEASVNAVDTYTQTAGALAMHAQLVTYAAADAGQPLYPTKAASWVPTNGTCQPADAGMGADLFAKGSPIRVVGLGFELINTTAAIYRQGAALCYRMPQHHSQSQVRLLNVAGTEVYNPTTRFVKRLPSYVVEASKLKGVQQWDAEQGAYVVCTQNGIENPFGVYGNVVNHIMDANQAAGEYSYFSSLRLGGANVSPVPTTCANLTKTLPVNYNSSGVFMTGLSEQSTFRLRVKVYVEIAPAPDNDLVVLATPSAPYDPMAFEIYSKALNVLPPAVPVGYNAKGDWWDMVLNVIGGVLPPLVSMIPGVGVPAMMATKALAQRMVDNTSSYGAVSKQQQEEAPKRKPRNRRKPREQTLQTAQANSGLKKNGARVL